MEKALESKRVPIVGGLRFPYHGHDLAIEVRKDLFGFWVIAYLFENKKLLLKKKVFIEIPITPSSKKSGGKSH